MKLQVGDIFVETNTNNAGNIGLIVRKEEEYAYYHIEWTCGTKCGYKKSQIQYFLDKKKLIHYPVVK